MPSQEMKEQFRAISWEVGIGHIRAGRSRVAIRRWREDAQRIVVAADARSADMRMALEELQLAVDLAARIGIQGPCAPEVLSSANEVRHSLTRWWADIADPALDRLFWDAQLPFLQRARNHASRLLAPQEKKALTQLIVSATQGRRPTFNEVHKLSLAHDLVLQEKLAESGWGNRQDSLRFH